MSDQTQVTSDRVKELLLADGVRAESVSPYLTALAWAESGKVIGALSAATRRTYESDARRVYRLLGQSAPQ